MPVLRDGDLVVWESLAILETLAERAPEARLWPDDPEKRAVARAVSAEMHAGFGAIRSQLPFNIRVRWPFRDRGAEVGAEIERLRILWREIRERYGDGGNFLFGERSIADAMFAPTVSRFVTYGVPLDGPEGTWAEAITALPEYQEWEAAARDEPWTIQHYEVE